MENLVDRPDVFLGRLCWHLNSRLLTVQRSVGCCVGSWKNAESSTDDEVGRITVGTITGPLDTLN